VIQKEENGIPTLLSPTHDAHKHKQTDGEGKFRELSLSVRLFCLDISLLFFGNLVILHIWSAIVAIEASQSVEIWMEIWLIQLIWERKQRGEVNDNYRELDKERREASASVVNVMLLLPVNDTSASNMVFSKVRSWSDVNEREKNNNNPVKSDILRTPSRCTLKNFSIH
jgi:hypothetical protein